MSAPKSQIIRVHGFWGHSFCYIELLQFCNYSFAGACGIPYLNFDVGVKGKEYIDSGTELNDTALLAGGFHGALL